MTYQAIIFDLDGTLLDTLQDLADATNHALRVSGFPSHPLEAFKYFVGDGRDILAWRALPENNRDKGTVDKIVDLIDTVYTTNWADHSHPYDGIPKLLDALTNRHFKMAVLSNKSKYFTELMVNKLLSKWYFEIVVGASADTPKKPDPTSTRQIIEKFKVKPEDIIYLGDTDIDMRTAVAAGVFPVGALWGFRDAKELLANGAKSIIRYPLDLIKLL